MPEHEYSLTVEWTGNTGSGTTSYRGYERSHTIVVEGKPAIMGSSDPGFRGDPSRYNPEELLLASLSSCHMLWYLHLCAEAGVIIVDYTDKARGVMEETTSGSGSFREVTLNPVVVVTEAGMIEKAVDLHQKANAMCFIANSVNFPVNHVPVTKCAVG
jgi:organic hydroperoxide reductase OsmC/OhrA